GIFPAGTRTRRIRPAPLPGLIPRLCDRKAAVGAAAPRPSIFVPAPSLTSPLCQVTEVGNGIRAGRTGDSAPACAENPRNANATTIRTNISLPFQPPRAYVRTIPQLSGIRNGPLRRRGCVANL